MFHLQTAPLRRNLFGNVKLSWGSVEWSNGRKASFSFIFYLFTHVQSVRMYDFVHAFVTMTMNGGCYFLVPTNTVCLYPEFNVFYACLFCWIIVQIIPVVYLPTFCTLLLTWARTIVMHPSTRYMCSKHVCQGINSHCFHIIGDGHQPHSSGLYTHYKDSY